MNIKDSNSYKQILKSTSIMGGSSVISIFFRIIQTKVLAILLGPSGIGLIGIYNSIVGLVSTIAGFQIGDAGVRQISEASSTNDKQKIGKTIVSVRRISLVLGIGGMCALLLLSKPISIFSFGNTDHTNDLAILSVTVFFGAVIAGQGALIQGMRRIKELALINVLCAMFGTLCSIPIVYFLGKKGIAPFLVLVSVVTFITFWWYVRKIDLHKVKVYWKDTITETKSLLKFAFAFTSSTVIAIGTMYLIRVVITRTFDLDAVGAYQASEALSSIYVGFILSAMGSDFYPRLTAIANDNLECTSLVNKQVEIGLLLAGPGIFGTIAFAPYIINIFYSSKFTLSVEILRWQALGVLLRVASWPMGYVLRAKGNNKLFILTELMKNAVHIGLIFFFIKYFGIIGTGMAFLIMYIFYWIMIFYVVNVNYDFKWDKANIRLCFILLPSSIVLFMVPRYFSQTPSILLSISITVLMSIYSLKELYRIFGYEGRRDLYAKIKSVVTF